MLFTWSIARNSRDPVTLATNGTFLLSKKGVLGMLNNHLHHSKSRTFLFPSSSNLFFAVINTYKLDRHRDEKIYFGRSEIKLMIETGLRNSARFGRGAAIRSFCILLTCFYTSIRPGSMGWTYPEYLHQGLVSLVFSLYLSISRYYLVSYPRRYWIVLCRKDDLQGLAYN